MVGEKSLRLGNIDARADMRLAGGFNAAVHLFAKRRRCYDSVAGGCKHVALFGAAADYQ